MDIIHCENCPLGQILGGQYSDTISFYFVRKLGKLREPHITDSFYFARKLGKFREPHITDWSL